MDFLRPAEIDRVNGSVKQVPLARLYLADIIAAEVQVAEVKFRLLPCLYRCKQRAFLRRDAC